MDSTLRVLDLFSGLNGWGDPFREAGHEVLAIDTDQRFEADAYLDIGDIAAALAMMPWVSDVARHARRSAGRRQLMGPITGLGHAAPLEP